MKDYWPASEKRYGMPVHLADSIKSIVRDYDRMKDEYAAILDKSANPPDGQPRGDNRIDTTSEKGMRCAELSKKLEAIEQARYAVQDEYRQGVWDNALYGLPYPEDADQTTYTKHKRLFMRAVAKKLHWL